MSNWRLVTTVALATLTGSAAAAMTPEALFTAVSPSVWVVRAAHDSSPVMSIGSAVAISPRLLVTACHVVASATGVTVARGGGTAVVKIDTVTHDPNASRDLCLLSAAEPLPGAVAGIAPIESVRVGEKVYAIGSPLGLELTLTDGLVSALRIAPGESAPGIQTSAATAPGSSGGGLFDEEGRLVGVTIAIASKETDNLTFAYPAQWVTELPSRIEADRRRWRDLLGVVGAPLDAAGAPVSSGFAAVDDLAALPSSGPDKAGVEGAYRQFLLLNKPRAFVMTSDHRWGAVSGAEALDSLLKDCVAHNVRCDLYAVDDAVVWRPAVTPAAAASAARPASTP